MIDGNAHFSLRDEARFTGGRQSFWSIDTKLRNRGVQFVSAGLHSTMDEDEDESEATKGDDALPQMQSTEPKSRSRSPKMATETLNASAAAFVPASASASPQPDAGAHTTRGPRATPPLDTSNMFFVDTVGEKSAIPQTRLPVIRSPSPVVSDSSEDEIVFHGRAAAQARVVEDPVSLPSQEKISTSKEVKVQNNSWDDTSVEWVHRSKPGIGWSVPKAKKKAAPPQHLLMFRAPESAQEEEAYTIEDASAVDDYLENLQEHDPEFLQSLTFASRDLDIDLEDGHVQRKFKSLSVAEKVKKPTKGVFAPREEYAGISESESEDDDVEESDEDAEESDSDLDDENELDDVEIEDDIPMEAMDDETLAMLLSKQEELGIGSDELLLYDDGVDASVARAAKKYSKETYTPKKSRRSGQYPSASLMADVLDQDPYGGFDIMDFERPSLRKKKGKKLPFDVSDDELRGSIENAWENDRSKKREKKLEREELRAQGLLGSKSAVNKYGEGMTIWEIGKEFEMFLDSDDQEKAFPPMDKRRRKMIHEIAAEFNIKTKSVGAGKNRYTRLVKVRQTTEYSEHRFVARARKINMGFFPRSDAAKGKKALRVAIRGGGANNAGVRYRDGDIVGGAAPEIGVENRGRAMLEKMGWSSGTALGAMDNKGILRPIEHVVKNTKTGLG